MRHYCRPMLVFAVALFLAINCVAAYAETIWFPYANVSSQNSNAPSPFWGPATSPLFERIDNSSLDNLIFDPDDVFYSAGNSYFDSVDNDASFGLYLHNPTGYDYDGSGTEGPVTVQFLKADGTVIDENSVYSGSNKILDITPSLTSVTYDTGSNLFEVDVLSETTETIDYSVFLNQPPAEESIALTIKVVADYELDCQLRARNIGYARTGTSPNSSTGTDVSNIEKIQLYTYNGVSEDLFAGSYHVATLPHWREQHQKKNSGGKDWATIVRVVNTHTSADDIEVAVYEVDGTLVDTYTFASVPSGGRIAFAPSQFYDSVGSDTVVGTGIKREGYLMVYGEAPAAVGIGGRFSPLKTTYNEGGFRRRACYTHVLPLEIDPSVAP